MVCLGQILTVGVGGTETFQQTVEQAYLRLLGYQFCHVCQWRNHLAGSMDETIGATDVIFHHIDTIDTGITSLTVCRMVEQEVVIIVGNTVV